MQQLMWICFIVKNAKNGRGEELLIENDYLWVQSIFGCI